MANEYDRIASRSTARSETWLNVGVYIPLLRYKTGCPTNPARSAGHQTEPVPEVSLLRPGIRQTHHKKSKATSRLRVVAWILLPESFSSGSHSRAHIVAANSNGGNGDELTHDVDQSRPEARRLSQGSSTGQALDPASIFACFGTTELAPRYKAVRFKEWTIVWQTNRARSAAAPPAPDRSPRAPASTCLDGTERSRADPRPAPG